MKHRRSESSAETCGGCSTGEVGTVKGLRKGAGTQKRELVKAKKREKGQDIEGGKKGENLKEGEEGRGKEMRVTLQETE